MRWTKNFKQMIIGIILCGVIPLWITGCADKELIRKSALHYFEQGNLQTEEIASLTVCNLSI